MGRPSLSGIKHALYLLSYLGYLPTAAEGSCAPETPERERPRDA